MKADVRFLKTAMVQKYMTADVTDFNRNISPCFRYATKTQGQIPLCNWNAKTNSFTYPKREVKFPYVTETRWQIPADNWNRRTNSCSYINTWENSSRQLKQMDKFLCRFEDVDKFLYIAETRELIPERNWKSRTNSFMYPWREDKFLYVTETRRNIPVGNWNIRINSSTYLKLTDKFLYIAETRGLISVRNSKIPARNWNKRRDFCFNEIWYRSVCQSYVIFFLWATWLSTWH
jgi:hypothetical protein